MSDTTDPAAGERVVDCFPCGPADRLRCQHGCANAGDALLADYDPVPSLTARGVISDEHDPDSCEPDAGAGTFQPDWDILVPEVAPGILSVPAEPDPTAGERRHGRECAAGVTNGAARCQCATPAEPDVTAGERQGCQSPGCPREGGVKSERWGYYLCAPHAVSGPAEPDAGDVEDAMESLASVVLDAWRTVSGDETNIEWSRRLASTILASDWLDAVRRKAADDRAEQIAQAIEGAAVGKNATTRQHHACAARIARDSR